MVDFSKKVKAGGNNNPIHPIEIYNSLDRKSETSGLRDAQKAALNTWFDERQNEKDLIVKLHTGQGKTLIGLLILQSVLNQAKGPVLYVCPNNLLVEQTIEHAARFGVPCMGIDGEIPGEFYSNEKIVVASVQKVFNGKSKFGIGKRGEVCDTIILDDAHACVDSIKDSFTIRIEKKNLPDLFSKLFHLFEDDIISQGYGTYQEIVNDEYQTIAAVPYWSWYEKYQAAVGLIVEEMERIKTGELKLKKTPSLIFSWQLLKDNMNNCRCFFSGQQIEISPYYLDINQFPTFASSRQRIMMSATTLNDTFFVKDLGVSPTAIKNPILDMNTKWLGEKMLIMPSNFSDVLDRTKVINEIAKANKMRQYGCVALVSSSMKALLYKEQNCITATSENIGDLLNSLKLKKYEVPIVLVNRYDGIDLPDNSCRVLIFDSKPYQNNLSDIYEEKCLRLSDISNIRIAQKIEQGLGRSVRGEKDFSVILIIGEDLVHFITSAKTNKYFSEQTRKQIEIGKTLANLALEEIETAEQHADVLKKLIKQSIDRDQGWKDFYEQEMNTEIKTSPIPDILDQILVERTAESYFFNSDIPSAIKSIQDLLDRSNYDNELIGWYLQFIARFSYLKNKTFSNETQINAFKKNNDLLAPKTGLEHSTIMLEPNKRIENIVSIINNYDQREKILQELDEKLGSLSFGLESEGFERSLDFVGKLIGFETVRPDKSLKQGPDNLWSIGGNDYFLFECKTEVLTERKEINTKETGQILNSCHWFSKTYLGCQMTPILIIPTKDVSEQAALRDDVLIMRKIGLKTFKNNIRAFVNEILQLDFSSSNLKELITESIQRNHLDKKSFIEKYFEKPFQKIGKRTL